MIRHRVVTLVLVFLAGVRQGLCGLGIHIQAGKDEKTSTVSFDGYIVHAVSDTEAKTFKLDGEKLSNLVSTYFKRSPTNAFLKSPAEVHGVDLYKDMGWTEVSTHTNVTSSYVRSFTSNPVAVKTADYEYNKTLGRTTFSTGITDEVSETAESSWTTGGTVTISESITVSFGFLGTDGESETDFSYSQSWGIGGSHSSSVTIGSSDRVSGDLSPGEKVHIVLSASMGTMEVVVNYLTHLVGRVAVNYDPPYLGHNFWPLQIEDMMASVGMTNAIKSTEIIKINFFANAKVTVSDAQTGEVLSVFDVPTSRQTF